MELSPGAKFILERLTGAGYEAYAVGGCVRDSLMGQTPGDWDVCTSARPEQTEAVFSDCRCIETGIRHGTVTVLYEGAPYEVTTFRRDGDYRDHRRPEQVTFVSHLTEDLRRRDFTVNAMALGLDGALRDPFDGQGDLQKGIIRCVGDPDARFQEDALRILRALRFAARLGFSIEPETARAMERNNSLLESVSPERIYRELTGLLTGAHAPEVLERYGTVLLPVLPEIGPAMGFLQHSPYHDRDVWGHTLQALGYSAPDPMIRWTLLLHDLGKPDTFTLDDRGVGHFYGHHLRSEALAREILTRLRAERDTIEGVCTLVRHHDAFAPPEPKHVRRWLGRYGETRFFQLMEVMRADTLAHVKTEGSIRRYEGILTFTRIAQTLLEAEDCFTVRDLAVNGRDVLALGVPPGPRVGKLLEALLDDVIEERCANDRAELLARLEIMEKEEPHAD